MFIIDYKTIKKPSILYKTLKSKRFNNFFSGMIHKWSIDDKYMLN